MKRFLLVILSAILISGLIFSGCGEPTEEPVTEEPVTEEPVTEEPVTEEPEPEKTEILLGAINSMTGLEAMVGTEHRWAYQQAVYDINAAGGVYVEDITAEKEFESQLLRRHHQLSALSHISSTVSGLRDLDAIQSDPQDSIQVS